ncbi:acyl-CoA thioesterase [Pseudofulvibacter geojedonensis]|uniref:Acyl-CoA thioesterase n=1 Tax=Pseudofulvibacter geojedonensis TaxID=1123758 RepID=A0ABW3I282_9FLAO
MKNVSELLAVLNLEEKSSNSFNGVSETVGSPNVFGGQVLAQAVNAAYRTINNGRSLHSLHSYFLEAGDLNLPITYQVEIIRDGGSFSTRRVTAQQGDNIIFILAASFHKEEKGYEHQVERKTNIKLPEDLLSWNDLYKRYGFFLPKKVASFLKIERPVIFKPTIILNPLSKKDLKPYSDVWFKVKGDTNNLSLAEKQQVLTYLSDYNILAAALYPHASKAHFGNTQMASLDHAMWFFRDFDLDDWLLFSVDVPSTSNARGFTRAHIHTKDGKLIASATQEGLMRPKKK